MVLIFFWLLKQYVLSVFQLLGSYFSQSKAFAPKLTCNRWFHILAVKYILLSFFKYNGFDHDEMLTGAENPYVLGDEQSLLVILSIYEVVNRCTIEVPSITSLILNSWSIRLGSLFQSLRGLTTPTLRCAYVILHWTLFRRLANRLSNVVVSFISNFDDYLRNVFDRLDLLYTIQYFIQLFSFLQFFSN